MTDLFDQLPEAPPRVTERDMLELLHQRYSQTSQGTARHYDPAKRVCRNCNERNPR